MQMKTTLNHVDAALEARFTEVRIDTLVRCLLRIHATFGSDSEMFEMLERDLLADYPITIKNEAQSRFYEATREIHDVTQCPVNPAWNLD